jgi:6-phosphofructokinase 2
MVSIVTVTMNPALDVATEVEQFVAQKKLRCSKPRYDPGGGGINVARMIKELGGESTAFVMAGGPSGERLRSMLAGRGINARFLAADGDTRQSLTVVERATSKHFRFVLPGEWQGAEKAEEALASIADLIEEQGATYVVVSGSLPDGVPEDFTARTARIAREHGARVILDTSGPPLARALDEGVYLVRINREEASELAGGEDHDPAAQARALLERKAAKVVIIALGSEGALVASTDGVVRIRSPGIEVVSAVGAGDCFVGALTFALVEGRPLIEASRLAVAAASAAVRTPATELAHRHDIEALYEKTSVER